MYVVSSSLKFSVLFPTSCVLCLLFSVSVLHPLPSVVCPLSSVICSFTPVCCLFSLSSLLCPLSSLLCDSLSTFCHVSFQINVYGNRKVSTHLLGADFGQNNDCQIPYIWHMTIKSGFRNCLLNVCDLGVVLWMWVSFERHYHLMVVYLSPCKPHILEIIRLRILMSTDRAAIVRIIRPGTPRNAEVDR